MAQMQGMAILNSSASNFWNAEEREGSKERDRYKDRNDPPVNASRVDLT